MSCPSTECDGQFSSAPEEILQMIVDPMTFDAPFSSNMCSNEDLQLASDDGNGNISDNPGYSLLTADLNNFEGDILGTLSNCLIFAFSTV